MASKTRESRNTRTADELKGDLQERVTEAETKGYFGHAADETPNENYTLAGVNAGLPTPENTRKAAPSNPLGAEANDPENRTPADEANAEDNS